MNALTVHSGHQVNKEKPMSGGDGSMPLTRCSKGSASSRRTVLWNFRLGVMALMVVLAAIGLAGCNKTREAAEVLAQAHEQPNAFVWNYQESKDEMTDKTLYFASVMSENAVRFDPPYDGEQHAILQLVNRGRNSKFVILRIQRGQFLCNTSPCTVDVRFDEGEVQHFSAVQPDDGTTEMLALVKDAEFVSQLRKARKLRMSAAVYREGSPVFTFNVEGLRWIS